MKDPADVVEFLAPLGQEERLRALRHWLVGEDDDAGGAADPLVAAIREERAREQKRAADLSWAAMILAPTLIVAQALYRGRNVPRQALDARYRDQLVCWDGVLTQDVVLDVLVLHEAYRLAGDIEQPSRPSWERRRAA